MATVYVKPAPNFVRWRELHSEFKRLYPKTVEDVLINEATAKVLYLGYVFEIRPHPLRHVFDFEVWGAPAINQFPQEVSL